MDGTDLSKALELQPMSPAAGAAGQGQIDSSQGEGHLRRRKSPRETSSKSAAEKASSRRNAGVGSDPQASEHDLRIEDSDLPSRRIDSLA